MNDAIGIAALEAGVRGLLLALATFAAISAAWWLWETLWDRRLFASSTGGSAVNLGTRQVRELIDSRPDLQILDLRTPAETARGTLPGARRVTWGEVGFRQRMDGWDRSRPILVYCEGGYRSRKAVPVLRELGFTSIHHLHRGMMSWRWAGHPVASDGSPNERRGGPPVH